jgi:hypothetical protein
VPPASDERAARLTEVGIVQLQEKQAAARAEADGIAARLEQLNADVDGAAKRTSDSISSVSKEVQRLLAEAAAAIATKQQEAAAAADAAVSQVQTNSNTELEQLRGQNATVLAEFKDTVTAQQAEAKQQADATLADLKATVSAERTRITNTLAQLQEQFSTAQEERLREANEQKTQIEKEASAVQSAIKQAADGDRSQTKAAADARLTELDSLLGNARDLVGTIAATGTSGVYGKEALAQQKQANSWRLYAVLSGIVTGVVALFAVLGDSKVFTVSITSSAKLVAALAFGSLATYCGRQASRHRMREERARRLELELSAFPPFLAKLEEAEQREVVRDYFQKVFVGYNDGGPPIQASDDQIGVARQVASSVTSRVKKQGAST